MSFRYDTRHLSKQVQAIIRERDKTNEMIKNSDQNTYQKIYPVSIFMRLGENQHNKFNGHKTINTYIDFCNINGSAWFSTDSLHKGMSQEKQNEFSNAIREGYKVEIYFAIGHKGGGKNEIEFKAEVIKIDSNEDKASSPNKDLTPDEWKDDSRYIWILIRNLQETGLRSKNFIVISSKRILTQSIAKSQFHFGYIKKAL